jgi:hypothetical protein
LDFTASDALDGEYSRQQTAQTGTRLASGFISSENRAFGRGIGGYPLGRDTHHQSGFETDEVYRVERNEFGKRERS